MEPGTLIYTDKKFNMWHAIVCFGLAIAKGGIAGMQLEFYVDTFSKGVVNLGSLGQILFWCVVVESVLVCMSEIVYLYVIAKRREAEYLSIVTGVHLDYAPQPTNPSRYLFTVVENTMRMNFVPLKAMDTTIY